MLAIEIIKLMFAPKYASILRICIVLINKPLRLYW